MNNIKLVIVEDDPIIVLDLETQLAKSGIEVMASFESGEETLEYLNQGDVPDIIIVDIHLFGKLDGIGLAHEINKELKIPTIFLTSNTDEFTFSKAKLTSPHAFLSKPFRISDVLHSIELALDMNEDDSEDNKFSIGELTDRIFIRDREHMHKVMLDNILYLEADGAYTKIITDSKTYSISQTLRKVYERLESNDMVKIHRSFVINIQKVDRISEGVVYINNERIPVSRSFKDQLSAIFKSL